jgi:hypothetical protein
MKKTGIIYILGAGASSGALPLVDEMFDRLKIFYLIFFVSSIFDPLTGISGDRQKRLLEVLKKFLVEIEDRRSIDTYAKELYIKKDISRLNDLKAVLGTYLLFEEMFSDEEIRSFFKEKFGILRGYIPIGLDTLSDGHLNNINIEIKNKSKQPVDSGPEYFDELDCLKYLYKLNKTREEYENNKEKIDQRYVNFLIDVMEEKDKFPDKIKVFSWNYDSQFPLAITNLGFEIPYIEGISEYGFLKRLNGIAVKKRINPAFGKQSTLKKILDCSNCFWRLHDCERSNDNLLLKFAFEQVNQDIETEISSHIGDFDSVSDLVIIGYSFPLSNRNIDRKVVEVILDKVPSSLKKAINLNVYLQVPPSLDINNNSYIILKNKIIGLIKLIKSDSVSSVDGSELSYKKKISKKIEHGNPFLPRMMNEERTIKIKFYEQWDPKNFHIPYSF